MENEYIVIIYDKNTKIEEYEYFRSFKKAKKYANSMKDNNNEIAIQYDGEIIKEIF